MFCSLAWLVWQTEVRLIPNSSNFWVYSKWILAGMIEADWMIKKQTKHLIIQLMEWLLIEYFADWLIARLIDWSISIDWAWLTGRWSNEHDTLSHDWIAELEPSWCIDQQIDWLFGELNTNVIEYQIDWLNDWLYNWPISNLINWVQSRTNHWLMDKVLKFSNSSLQLYNTL